MINFGPDFKNKTALSPSRIDTLAHCYQKYYANYFLKIPDKGNAGSQRGGTLHDTMEFLELKENKKYKNKILESRDVRKHKKVWDKVLALAKHYTVDDEENLGLINQFIVTAVEFDQDPDNMVESFSEKSFDFEEINGEINYRVRGRFDKYYICKDKASNSLYIRYLDYKSSKTKFDKDKINLNLQGGIYQRSLEVLHPDINLREFQFIFVKFPKQPIQEFELLSEDEMFGFKIYLTEIQRAVNNFSELNIPDNIGYLNPKMKNLCGPAKSGWICPHQNPLDYYIIENEKGEIVSSAFTEEEITKKLQEMGSDKDIGKYKVVKKHYKGCYYFFDQDTGKRRNLNFNVC